MDLSATSLTRLVMLETSVQYGTNIHIATTCKVFAYCVYNWVYAIISPAYSVLIYNYAVSLNLFTA